MTKRKIEIQYKSQKITNHYYEINGISDGPTLIVSGGMHGNEVNGMYQVFNFINWCKENKVEKSLHGKIVVLPVLNVEAYQEKVRRTPYDNYDLNRSFGFSKPNTITEIYAQELENKIFKNSTLIIDIHDAGGSSELIPHTRVSIDEEHTCKSCSKEIAQLFGFKYNLEREGDSHMLAVHMMKTHGIPTLTVEIGGGGELYHQEWDYKTQQGIQNIMIRLGMIKGEIKSETKQIYTNNRFWIRLPFTAIIKLSVELGQKVSKGEILGSYYNPINLEQGEIKANSSGIIFSKNEDNQVKAKNTIVSILSLENEL